MARISSVTTAVVEANFDYTFVCIEANDGTRGFGESFFSPGLPEAIREIGALIVGEDPTRVRYLVNLMKMATSASSGSAGEGALLHAISGIETALWDVTGKLLGIPVWQLLGGKTRDAIPVYADLHAGTGLPSIDNLLRRRSPFWSDPSGKTVPGNFYWLSDEENELDFELIVSRVDAAAEAGFKMVKLDVDIFEESRDSQNRELGGDRISRIVERASELRKRVSSPIEIAYDCHWRFDVPSACRLHAELSATGAYWLEDPVPPTPEGLARVAASGSLPIASGENAYSLEGVVALADGGGVDIVTPDVQKIGGLLEAVSVADWAHRHGLGVAPHCIASPLGFVAAVHVLAAAPSVRFLEFHGSDTPFWAELVTSPVIVSGFAPVPDGPGLGVELNLEILRQYASPSQPFFTESAVDSRVSPR